MEPTPSKRLQSLPPYLFVRLAELKAQALDSGLSVIDLGQGSPDTPTPENVVEALCTSVREETWTHRYPPAKGTPELRQAIAGWYQRRFGVKLDPETEVLPLIGSKEGLAHLYMALLDPGDGVLVPNPCYPVHYNGVVLAGGTPHLMPLREENGFVPDLDAIKPAEAKSSKIMVLNYPNNPTGACLDGRGFLDKAVAFCAKNKSLLVYDNAYSELVFDGYSAPSVLQVPGAKEHAVEFHSFSKTYSMAGWRIGFAVGNAAAVGTLYKYKGFLDYGVPAFLQQAAVKAISGPQGYVRKMQETYRSRRDAMVKALAEAGWKVPVPKGSMYIWSRLPEGWTDSMKFGERLILEQGVVLAPGVGFGPYGEGYVRISLIASEAKLIEAAGRIGKFLSSAVPAK